MSYILTYVRVVLATSVVQSILEIAATDEIHMEDRNHGVDEAEQRHIQQTCTSTATFESCGTRTTNGAINLYIKLEKHELDQIAERNISISLGKRIAFS